MSGKVVSWAFEQKTGSPAAKLVLVKLADNANEYGFCWVGLERIIEDSELSQSAVYKHVATLQGLGLVTGPFDSTHPEDGYPIRAYQLSVPEAWRAIPPRGKKGKGKIPPGGKLIPPGGKRIPQGGKAIPPGGIHIEEPSSEPSVEPSLEQQEAAVPPGGGDLFGESDLPKPLSQSEIMDAAYAAYDATAERSGWAKVQMRTATRDKHLKTRLDEVGGLDGWKAALEKAEASDFLCGRAPPSPGRRQFRADFDFLMQQSSFVKLMEGKYDNRSGGAENGHGGFLAAAAHRASADPY